MMARQSVCTSVRRGLPATLPHGTVVVNEHGSLGANPTTSSDCPWNSSAVFGARVATW
jgi:hypothetical protein